MMIGHLGWEKIDFIGVRKHLAAMLDSVRPQYSTFKVNIPFLVSTQSLRKHMTVVAAGSSRQRVCVHSLIPLRDLID